MNGAIFKLNPWPRGALVLAVMALISFAPAPLVLSAAAEEGPDAGAFSIKNGIAFKNDAKIDAEVCAMPEGISNGILSWAVFGESTLTEAEMGIWFFGENGKYNSFVPLDFQAECQDVLWSPSGGWFVLMSGPDGGPWSAYADYRLWKADVNGMRKTAEFNGVRDQIAWLPDGERFVYARADGTRETPGGDSDPYAPRVSAVLHDPATGKEIALKEATETQNYYLGGSPWDGEPRIAKLVGDNVALSEEYVESPSDWGEEGMEAGKYKKREVEVPLPPALAAPAAPAAYIESFPAGEELTEFLRGKKVEGVNPADVEKVEKEYPGVFVVLEPIASPVTVGLYDALYDDETDAVLPDGEQYESAELSDGEVFLFWAPIPEGLPKLVVKLVDGGDEYLWIPRLSDLDDTLITSEVFLPWAQKNER